MSSSVATLESRNYVVQLLALVRLSVTQLLRPPTHARRSAAALRLRRDALLIVGIGGALVIALMFGFDVTEIALMPPRGSPGVWWARDLTDFGKDVYVLWALFAALVLTVVVLPLLHGPSRARLLRFGTRLEYVFVAVVCANLVAEVLKYAIGRGRPFVGGKANAFNFRPFAGTEAYFSLPSAHAVTAFALACAVGAIWPRSRLIMFAYAALIAATRLALLAHHPSDVVAGAVIGILASLGVRYWFAARRLGFAVRNDGQIVPI
ncbi:MAG TPA: phosphatase PAP2 family protein [Bradyrhizobium sp.]|nr:phosphatase PAP2 family protein [Bradyrhizobium sp.]